MVNPPRTVLVAHPGAEMFGSDRMLLESVRGLLDAGARVVVALPSRGMLDVELRSAGAEVVIIPMLVLRRVLLTPKGLPQLIRDTFRGLGAGWRLMRRVRPDAVYVSTTIIPQWPIIARLRGTRAVSHIHEAESSANRLFSAALYLPHLASQRTVTNSRFSLETIRHALRPLARRTTVVYNGVASPDHPAPPRPTPDAPLRMLYLGRLSPRKGPDVAIAAASILRTRGIDVRVTLLGAVFEGYEWFEQQLREQAETAGLEVDFAGFHPDVWPYLAAADVLVVPSRDDESFGNTVVEGILALRPVIASGSSGLSEATAGYETTRSVPRDDPAALADALTQVREKWERTVAQTDDARDEALRRHAPEIYRAAIAAVVLGE